MSICVPLGPGRTEEEAGDAVLTPGRCGRPGQDRPQQLTWQPSTVEMQERVRAAQGSLEGRKDRHPGPGEVHRPRNCYPWMREFFPRETVRRRWSLRPWEARDGGPGGPDHHSAETERNPLHPTGGSGEAMLKTTEQRVPATPMTPRTRVGERGVVPTHSRTKALAGDLRAEGGGRTEGTGEGRKQEAQEGTSPAEEAELPVRKR